MDNQKKTVTIIGLGPMGQAMSRVFLNNGYLVTVWNRTKSKAETLIKEGAIYAETVSAALKAGELVIVSLTDYQAMYDIFEDSEKDLAGRIIVNLSSDTPAKSRDASKWLVKHEANLIVGGIMVPAILVGKEGAYVFYSGQQSIFSQCENTLKLIGRADYVGADPGLAQLYYQAQLDIFLTSLASYLHATALLGTAGVSAKTFLPYAVNNFDSISSYLSEAARDIDEAEYPGDLANVIMMGATAHHITETSRQEGIDLNLPNAVKALYDLAIATGHGRDNWTSLIEVIKKPSVFVE